MTKREHASLRLFFFSAFSVFCTAVCVANEGVIQFDLAPTAELTPAEDDPSLVTFTLSLSSLIQSPSAPEIDQWVVRIAPRDAAIQVADYSPRTETASEIDGPIQTKTSNESTQSIGLQVDGHYGKSLHGGLGADKGSKQTHSEQYNRVAPVQAVAVSGTFDRGRGVFFKLRWTARQILEGEKTFSVTLRVPDGWRGGLVDVSVRAESAQRSFPIWEPKTRTLGAADFVIATYHRKDVQTKRLAHQIAVAEQSLRDISSRHRPTAGTQSLSSLLHGVAAKLDLDAPHDQRWLERLLVGQTDPYQDEFISRLPMEVRVAAIEYHDARVDYINNVFAHKL